jgi:hypothetical protein
MSHILDDDHLGMAIIDLEHGPFDDRKDEYFLEDIECLKEIIRVSNWTRDNQSSHTDHSTTD